MTRSRKAAAPEMEKTPEPDISVMSIDQLREMLARKILIAALAETPPNPQFQLDSYKATAPTIRGKARPEGEQRPAGMALFEARLRQAEQTDSNGADDE